MVTARAERSRLPPRTLCEMMPESLNLIAKPDVRDGRAAQVAEDNLSARIFVAQQHVAIYRHDQHL